MKKPEEIKKGLAVCSVDECHGQHTECPYHPDLMCIRNICNDALAYIQQLEEKVAMLERVRATQATSVTTMQDALFKQQLHQSRLLEERSQLEAERDAAVKDLCYAVSHPHTAGVCYACKHHDACQFQDDCDIMDNNHWEWRGVQKEG